MAESPAPGKDPLRASRRGWSCQLHKVCPLFPFCLLPERPQFLEHTNKAPRDAHLISALTTQLQNSELRTCYLSIADEDFKEEIYLDRKWCISNLVKISFKWHSCPFLTNLVLSRFSTRGNVLPFLLHHRKKRNSL